MLRLITADLPYSEVYPSANHWFVQTTPKDLPSNLRAHSGMDAKPRLRERIPLKHYSYRTELQFISWVRRFTLFHGKRHPADVRPVQFVCYGKRD